MPTHHGDLDRPIRLEYWAGLFDGEGCVSINKKGREHQLRVIVGMSCAEIPELLKAAFGGSVYQNRSHPGKVFTYWTGIGATAVHFLQSVLPHLIVKRREAELALSFNRFKKDNLGMPLTKEVLVMRDGFVNRLKGLRNVTS